MTGRKSLIATGLFLGVAAAWLAPPPWPLADPEAGYALQARELVLGRPQALSEPLPVLGAAPGLFLAGDSDYGARLAGMLTGPILAGLAWGLSPQLGRTRATILAALWGLSPLLALGGRTVGPAAWLNFSTAIAVFGLIHWQASGRAAFLNLAVIAAGALAASGWPGWAALGGLGAAAVLSLRLAGKAPHLRPTAALPGLVAGGSVLTALAGAFGLSTGFRQTPDGGLPPLLLLAVYEPLTFAGGLAGLLLEVGRLSRKSRPDFVTALGIFWPAAGILTALLPPGLDPFTSLGPAALALGLAASGPITRLLDAVVRDTRGIGPSGVRLALGGALMGALMGFLAITFAGATAGQVSGRVMAGFGVALISLGGVGIGLSRDPVGRRLVMLAGLGFLGAFAAHQFFRVNYGPGPELLGPPRPGQDLAYLVQTARDLADRRSAKQAVDPDGAPPSVRWALRHFPEGPAGGFRVESFAGDPGLGVVKIPAGYPDFKDGWAFLRWLLYREYDRLRTVDFVLKGGGP